MNWTLRVIYPTNPNPSLAEAFAVSLAAIADVTAKMSMPCLHVYDPAQNLTRAILHQMAQDLGLDIVIKSHPPQKCKLLVADMEATIIRDEMLDLLAEARGIGDAVAKITAQAMAGQLDFAQSLIARTEFLAGTTEDELQALSARIRYMPGAKSLVQTMRGSGAKTVLVTGGYDIFARDVARHCGFDDVVANRPVLRGGVMTGALHRPICTAKTKRDVLRKNCEDLGIGPHSACCVGDGANDILMLEACGLSVSYKGKPVVREIVDLNITNGDLTAVLTAQGFMPSQIVRD